jgi:hypothetical protein
VWDAFRFRGRRVRNRRASEHARPYLVDRFPARTFLLVMMLIGLTLADGLLTLQLMDGDCHETNPIMCYLLGKGIGVFLLGKYLLTVGGLPVLLVFKNYYLFGTRFRVGYLIPVFVAAYLVLVTYEVALYRAVFA